MVNTFLGFRPDCLGFPLDLTGFRPNSHGIPSEFHRISSEFHRISSGFHRISTGMPGFLLECQDFHRNTRISTGIPGFPPEFHPDYHAIFCTTGFPELLPFGTHPSSRKPAGADRRLRLSSSSGSSGGVGGSSTSWGASGGLQQTNETLSTSASFYGIIADIQDPLRTAMHPVVLWKTKWLQNASSPVYPGL